MKFTKKRKNLKGFTLVELIIVIAIIGILAGILIPTMTGKIKEAKQRTADDSAAKIAEQAAIISTELETKGISDLKSNRYYANNEGSGIKNLRNAASGSAEEQIYNAITGTVPGLKDPVKHWGISFNDAGGVKAVVYWEEGSSYVGRYPASKRTLQPTDADVGATINGWLTAIGG